MQNAFFFFVTGSVGKISKRKCDLWTGTVELPYRFYLIRIRQSLKVVKNPYPETHIHQYLNSAESNILLMLGFFFKLFVWQKEAMNCDQSDLCLGRLPYDPAIRIHHVFVFMAGTVRSHLKRNVKVLKIQKQTWDWRGHECTMHVNLQHSLLSPLSTVAASGRTRLTSVRLIFFFF